MDAKFETQVNQETKQALIKEYMQHSSSEELSDDEEVCFVSPTYAINVERTIENE